jgi:hypothetical protein
VSKKNLHRLEVLEKEITGQILALLGDTFKDGEEFSSLLQKERANKN